MWPHVQLSGCCGPVPCAPWVGLHAGMHTGLQAPRCIWCNPACPGSVKPQANRYLRTQARPCLVLPWAWAGPAAGRPWAWACIPCMHIARAEPGRARAHAACLACGCAPPHLCPITSASPADGGSEEAAGRCGRGHTVLPRFPGGRQLPELPGRRGRGAWPACRSCL